VVSPCPQGVAGSSLMGLLQLVVRFLTSIKNTLTGFFSGGDQTSSTSSSGGKAVPVKVQQQNTVFTRSHTALN